MIFVVPQPQRHWELDCTHRGCPGRNICLVRTTTAKIHHHSPPTSLAWVLCRDSFGLLVGSHLFGGSCTLSKWCEERPSSKAHGLASSSCIGVEGKSRP